MTIHSTAEGAMTTNQRFDRAYQMRTTENLDFDAIAYRLGFASRGGARHAYIRGMERATGERYDPNTGNRSARRSAARRSNSVTAPNTDRRFGIEIEFVGIDIATAAAAIRNAGLNCNTPGYTHRLISEWKVVPDGSLGHHNAGEAVSPPLRGDEGFRQVRLVMEALVAAGAKVNRRCGLHVHHDATDLSGDAIARTVEFYFSHQPAIDTLLAPSRRNGAAEYIDPLSPTEVQAIANAFRASSFDRTRQVRWEGTRYRYRNINAASAFARHGTVEVRQHQGTLNADKAIAWIKFGQSFIRAAEAGVATAVPTTVFEMLTHLNTHHDLDSTSASFLMERAFHFSAAE